jgi:hypothetical protein
MVEAFIKTIKRGYVWVSALSDAETVMKQLPKGSIREKLVG